MEFFYGIKFWLVLKFGHDHKGRAVHYIFCFLKKETKGCHSHPSCKSFS